MVLQIQAVGVYK